MPWTPQFICPRARTTRPRKEKLMPEESLASPSLIGIAAGTGEGLGEGTVEDVGDGEGAGTGEVGPEVCIDDTTEVPAGNPSAVSTIVVNVGELTTADRAPGVGPLGMVMFHVPSVAPRVTSTSPGASPANSVALASRVAISVALRLVEEGNVSTNETVADVLRPSAIGVGAGVGVNEGEGIGKGEGVGLGVGEGASTGEGVGLGAGVGVGEATAAAASRVTISFVSVLTTGALVVSTVPTAETAEVSSPVWKTLFSWPAADSEDTLVAPVFLNSKPS